MMQIYNLLLKRQVQSLKLPSVSLMYNINHSLPPEISSQVYTLCEYELIKTAYSIALVQNVALSYIECEVSLWW